MSRSGEAAASRAATTLTARSIGHRRSLDSLADPNPFHYDLDALSDAEVDDAIAQREYHLDSEEAHREAWREARRPRLSLHKMSAANNSNNNLFETRQAPSSPASSHAGASAGQMNGNSIAGTGYMPPLPAGHQQDLNYLYSQIQELSGILRSNREKVNGITKTAEEVAKRAAGGQNGVEGDKQSDAARIHELELALAKANRTVDLYKHEQTENTKLIAEYEDAMGTATEQIRNYCCDNNDRYLAQRRHYNNLLQAEKDEHLQSRLDRDHWHAQTMKVCGMIRHAYRLRCEEWGEELAIISGLQNEVRVYRNAMGMEKERAEEETGWPYLKEAPLNLEGIDES